MTEPICTCDGRQQFVCHDIRNEPHLYGCPRWGTPKRVEVGTPVYGVTTEGKPITWHVTHVSEDGTITVANGEDES